MSSNVNDPSSDDVPPPLEDFPMQQSSGVSGTEMYPVQPFIAPQSTTTNNNMTSNNNNNNSGSSISSMNHSLSSNDMPLNMTVEQQLYIAQLHNMQLERQLVDNETVHTYQQLQMSQQQQLMHQQQQEMQRLLAQAQTMIQQHTQEQQLISTMCRGVTLSHIYDPKSKVQNKEDTEEGFHHLVGNAVRYQASYRSNNKGAWPFGNHIRGYLMDNTGNVPIWECVEIEGTVGFRKTDKCCTAFYEGAKSCCGCEDIKFRLFESCRGEVERRSLEEGPRGSMQQMKYMSPTITHNRMKSQSREIHMLQKRVERSKKTIEFLRAKAESIPNVSVEGLLGDEATWKKRYKEVMSRETNIEKKEIFELLFEEMAVVRVRKNKHGSHHGHIWSPLMIMFAGFVRFGNGASSGMNRDNWDFCAEAFNVPKNCTLMRYNHTDTSSPDGPCMETIIQNAEHMDNLRGDDLNHPIAFGKISLDSHKIKSRFGECM